MNEYEIALNNILKRVPPMRKDGQSMTFIESYTKLQELVDKETPMKVIHFHHCPKCEANVSDEMSLDKHYCSNCGQKIDWSDENE